MSTMEYKYAYLTIEFDYENGIFTKHTYGMKNFLNVIHKLYGTNGSVVYEYGKGEILPFSWESGTYTLNSPNSIKECEDIYLVGYGDEIEVIYKTEKKPKSKLMTLKPTINVYHKPLINFGRMFSIGFKHNTNVMTELNSFKAVMDIDTD